MKNYSMLKKFISRLLLLCMLVSLVPTGAFAQQEAGQVADPKPETKAAATDYRGTIDALDPPYHVRDYLPTLANDGASILGGGAYYFALPYDNGTKAHVLDLTGRFHRDEFFLSEDLSISNNTLVGVDTDLAFDCTKVYTGETLEKWRFRMYPVHGMTFKHLNFSEDGSYMVPVIGGVENYAVSSHNGLMGLHTYRKYTGDADYVHYTLTYDSSLGGFRFKRNINNPDSANNRLMAFKVAIQGAELYHAIQDVRDLAYGNGDGRYDAALYSNFITCLDEALKLYTDNNKLVDSDTQASLRSSMDAKATELLGHRGKLIRSDTQTSFIDIPVELLDFRADGFMFEYSDSAYGLIKDVSANANIYSYSHTHNGKDLTLPNLIDRQMIYTKDTVNYVANVINEGYRTDLSVSNKVPGWNSVFYNKSQTITKMGDWDSTLAKTDTKENGGVLTWKNVETFYDMAYYILNNLWRPVDETDSEEFIDQYNLTYGRKIPEIDRLRMYIDEDGMYTLDADYEILRDGYYLFNQYPRVGNRIVYDSPVFIPADGLGFEEPTLMEQHGYGDTDAGTWFYGSKFDCENANFHFTMHAYGSFVYYQSQNQEFTFIGDDDVYFYVNGQIALDIGAAHEALGGTVRLNDIADKLGLVDGEVYDFDMFYAERHTTASNLRFSTNIKIVDAQTLTTKGQYLERSAGESYVDNQLGTGSHLIDNAAVKVGDTVAYSFELLNRRPVPVFDVSFKDMSLGAELSPTYVTLYDPAKTNGAVTGEKDITFFYRSYDTETGTVDTSNPQFVTLTEMEKIINSVLVRPDGVNSKEYDSFPVGSYAVKITEVSEITELLTLGVPRNCKLSVYGFKRNTVAGDTPYTNTVTSHCSYKRALSAESNIEQEEVFYIDGIASRVLQVTASLPDAVPQKFVLDYGKALEIPLDYLRSSIRTDSLVQVDTLVGFSRTGRNAEHLKNLPKDVICTKVGDREALGQGTLTRGDTAVVYQLTDFMDQIERVYAIYSLKGCNTIDQKGDVTEYKYITVEILLIPATMMYYESDFAVGAISVDDPCNTLFFDFKNTEEDRLRYQNAAYGGFNFDLGGKGFWASHATEAGKAANYTNWYIDNDAGTLTVYVGDDLEGEKNACGPKIMTTNTYTVFPWTGRGAYAPLKFNPKGAEVLEVRFRVDGCIQDGYLTTPAVEMEYHLNDAQGSDQIKYAHSRTTFTFTQGQYITKTLTLSNAFKDAKEITSLGLRFVGIKSPSNDNKGTVTIDYIYVGPKKQAETDSTLAQSQSGWSIVTDTSPSDAYQDLDMNTATATQSGNAILRQLHSDTQVQPEYYGAQNATEKLTNGSPLSFSHRGAWETVPQNSLLAVYESIMLGIHGAEIDLRLSKDGVLVLCHDDHIRSCTTVSSNATDAEALVKNLNWADLKTKAVVAPYATGSQDLDYPITEAQASILNSLPEYLNHYGAAAKAGDKLTMARLDDVLDLMKQYGPDTLLTLDKMDSAEIFAASYKLVRDKGMLDRVIFKCSKGKSTFDSWITAAATACGIAENTVKTSMHMMYVVGASSASNLTEIKNHANNGGYLQSVEITYGADSAASAEAGIRSTLKPYCQTNGIALYGSSIGETYCGGKNDAEGTWAHLLALGYDGIMTDAPTELAAYMNAYNTQKAASQTIQAEHFQSCNNETMHFRLQQNRDSNGNKLVRGMQNGDYLVYENISFTGTESKLYFRTQGLQHGAILRFYLDEVSSGNCLAAYTLGMDAEPYTLSTSLRISIPAGVHRVIVQVSGVEDVDLLNFDSFSFAPEQHYLFFDFTDTEADRERYSGSAYGPLNSYDTANAWKWSDNITNKQMENGSLNFGFSNDQTWGYVQTGGTLNFKPGRNDVAIIRLRIQNAEPTNTSNQSSLYFYFGRNGAAPTNAYRIDYPLDLESMDTMGYVTIRFPLNHAGYLSADYISSIRIYFDRLRGKNGQDAQLSIDYIYLGPVRPTESLYFGFGNSEADELRYKDPVYGGNYNYDKEGEDGYWATHSTAVDTTDPAADRERNQKNYTIDNSSGTFTLQVGDSKEGESKHGPKFMTSNQYGVYPWTGRGQYAPLRFNPASAEVIVVRFKLTNCSQASGEALELQVDMHFQDSNGTLYNRYNVTNVPYSATNGVYQTVTIPLSGFATRVPLLTSLGLRFVGIKKPSATDVGTVTIDYLYMGPRSESPAEQALYFDFSHSISDQQRYNSPVYGYLDYDLEGEGYWATYATHNDDHEDGTINERNYSMDNSAGTLTVSVGDGLEGESSAYGPKIMTTKTYGVYPYRSRGQHAPLHFDPTNAKYLEVRFRLDNVKKQAALTMQMEYHYHMTDGIDNIAYENTQVPYELRLGEYQTIQIPLSSTFKNAQEVTSLGLRFLGICSEDSQELGRVTIDYIYVGREEGLPSKARPVYGWDSSYIDDSKLSNGSSYFVHGQGVKLNDTTENYTQFSFDFVGTGFDLISRTGAKQATIRVSVYKAEDRSKVHKAITVNNKGELELYQIPVVSIQGLEHGAYYVTVGVNKAIDSIYDFLNRGGEFHFDALRIYDPIPNDDATDTEALETYRKDQEAYPYVKEIRDILLSADDFNALTGSKDGAIFIDTENFTPTKENQTESASGHITANVSTYNKLGPKNEVYLHPGQAVAFRVEIDAVATQLPASIDVGAKTILGDEAELVAGFVTSSTTNTGAVLTSANRITVALETSTSQYYALELNSSVFKSDKNAAGQTISTAYLVILNNSPVTADVSSNVISITDIKCAYDKKPTVTLPEDAPNTPEIKRSGTSDVEPVRFLVDARTMEAAEVFLGAGNATTVMETTVKISHSLNLASDIALNYAVPMGQFSGAEKLRMNVSIPHYSEDGTVTYETVVIEGVEKEHYYYFTLDGITAVQMNDTLSARLYWAENGEEYCSQEDIYSIATYAYSQLDKNTVADSLKTLCSDLLRYGAKAQLYKSYRADALADVAMTDTHKAYLSDMEAVTFGNTNKVLNDLENAPISWTGKALDLESKVALKFVFNPANYNGDPSALTLMISYADINGTPKSLSIKDPELYNPDMGLYVFTLDALLVAELRTVVSVQIFAGNIPVSCTLQYSADTYGNNKTGNLLELCKALFAYSDSAKAYFQ